MAVKEKKQMDPVAAALVEKVQAAARLGLLVEGHHDGVQGGGAPIVRFMPPAWKSEHNRHGNHAYPALCLEIKLFENPPTLGIVLLDDVAPNKFMWSSALKVMGQVSGTGLVWKGAGKGKFPHLNNRKLSPWLRQVPADLEYAETLWNEATQWMAKNSQAIATIAAIVSTEPT